MMPRGEPIPLNVELGRVVRASRLVAQVAAYYRSDAFRRSLFTFESTVACSGVLLVLTPADCLRYSGSATYGEFEDTEYRSCL
jgi:hypothetical protein